MNKTLPTVKDMIEGNASRYALVVGISKRAREIVSEHELKSEELDENPVMLAAEDFVSGYCDIDYTNSIKRLNE